MINSDYFSDKWSHHLVDQILENGNKCFYQTDFLLRLKRKKHKDERKVVN